jgi:hypothetical protein
VSCSCGDRDASVRSCDGRAERRQNGWFRCAVGGANINLVFPVHRTYSMGVIGSFPLVSVLLSVCEGLMFGYLVGIWPNKQILDFTYSRTKFIRPNNQIARPNDSTA